ncbi:MAG: NAD-dependent deacylase [Candidatus Cloacimonadales bacterium]|jgi:NAD-dependent deacetylase|nr:NAD-dependent deacylase [Candidatus Cloacimonadota bacterium]MDY0380668.1 NAD-dependent deacylase [Candidatus Cloacimonadaceae bacterium]HCM15742.1 NAD-dependent protein deacylase [Candidatus Cloacimonas sp.]MCB5257362.1 NAD-dependent deacylase [Candidatus Cloacimonadota bacterium]MCB5263648.1 NAD-dependent deacylase [Candidatus Cloacimonadota bacterium]
MKRYLVLTGAGISAESGIRTFRDSGGLWEEHRVEDVASPQGFQKNPKLVWDFYKERFKNSLSVNPNSAHQALKRMEDALGENFHLITQNVDGLHIKAGNRRVYEMHGSLKNCFCVSCRTRYELDEIDLSQDVPLCMKCKALLRPDIVWFGEIPYYLYEIEDKLKNCDVFIVVGTSGTVYPAAGFVMTAKLFGAKTIAVNLDRPDNLGFIDEFLQGKSGDLVPPLVEKLIG